MTQPPTYNRQFSFTNFAALSPTTPLPGGSVDLEFNTVKTTLDAINTNLALIQRSDGGVANASIGLDQLKSEVTVGFDVPKVWVTATAYAASATVFQGSAFYRCLVAHTAGVFATDLAAAKWQLIVDLSTIATVNATQVAVTPAGNIASTTVAGAINELDSEKAATSHTHTASAITDSTADGRAFLNATLAAQKALLGLGSLAFLNTIPVTAITANLAFTGKLTPAALVSTTNDWAPTGWATAAVVQFSSSSAITITGLLANGDGDLKVLENIGAFPVTIGAENTGSAAANRITAPRPVVIGPYSSAVFKYDGITSRWRPTTPARTNPRGWIAGCIMSNNSTQKLDVTAGSARDSTDSVDLVFSALTAKDLTAAWAAGSSAGMRSAAALADGTWHIFLIGRTDGASVDIFADTSLTCGSGLPAGYSWYRRIGSMVRSAGVFYTFLQVGDEFFTTLAADYNAAGVRATALLTLSIPTGLVLRPRLYIASNQSSTGGDCTVTIGCGSNSAISSVYLEVNLAFDSKQCTALVHPTNTSAQINLAVAETNNSGVQIAVRGWIDYRGKND